MKKLKLLLTLLGLLAALCILVGCTAQEGSTPPDSDKTTQNEPDSKDESSQQTQTDSEPDDSQSAQTDGQQDETSSQQPQEAQEATIYIGSNGNYQNFPLSYEGELRPETLIAAIAERTGWNLDLADEVTMGKGGVTVCFAKTSAFFSGPPAEQNPDFFVYDLEGLSASILDSIKMTLQQNFVDVAAGGNPESLPVYYCMEGDQPLVIEDIGITVPMDKPYTGFDALRAEN